MTTATGIQIEITDRGVKASWATYDEVLEIREELKRQNIHVHGHTDCWCEGRDDAHRADRDFDNPSPGPWFVRGTGELYSHLVSLRSESLVRALSHVSHSTITFETHRDITRHCWACPSDYYRQRNPVPTPDEDPDHTGLCDDCRDRLRSY